MDFLRITVGGHKAEIGGLIPPNIKKKYLLFFNMIKCRDTLLQQMTRFTMVTFFSSLPLLSQLFLFFTLYIFQSIIISLSIPRALMSSCHIIYDLILVVVELSPTSKQRV